MNYHDYQLSRLGKSKCDPHRYYNNIFPDYSYEPNNRIAKYVKNILIIETQIWRCEEFSVMGLESAEKLQYSPATL